jgi:hypothetical protein
MFLPWLQIAFVDHRARLFNVRGELGEEAMTQPVAQIVYVSVFRAVAKGARKHDR